jgi:hypothetical protein
MGEPAMRREEVEVERLEGVGGWFSEAVENIKSRPFSLVTRLEDLPLEICYTNNKILAY